MKNIFTRALALTIVFVLCAVSAFAAPEFGDVTYDLATGTLDVATSGYTAGKSATILVVKDGADLADLSANDIIYIDQVDNAVADQSYNDIPLEDRIAALNAAKAEGAADITAVNVYIGGSEVTAAIPYKGDGDTVAAIAVAEEEPTPEPVIETAYAVTVAAGEYTSLDEVKAAALTVTKTVTTNGVAAAPVTVAAGEYTVAYEDADGTVTITVTITADGETATTTATYTAPVIPEPPVTGKTGIAGTVKYKLGANWRNGEGALVLVVNSGAATIAGSAVADANGAFEVEVPAGTYNVVVRYSRLGYNTSTKVFSVTNYANTRFDGITVTEGATTTLASADVDYVVMNARAKGDATDDGVVDTADLTAVKQGLAAAAK